MKKVIITIGIIVVIIIIAVSVMVYIIENKIDNIQINDIDLSDVQDGEYTGSYDVMIVSVKVKVTVKDNLIKNIEILKHNNGEGSSAEVIVDSVIDEQSLEVDAISGATVSSKVILKAIENALE